MSEHDTMAPSENLPQQPSFVLVALQCGCTVMQRRESNERLFQILQRVPERGIILYCPAHKRQQVKRLIKRTQRRAHWPLVEHVKCSSCLQEMTAPPPSGRTG